MKKLSLAFAMVITGLISLPSQAAVATGTFNVTINFTSVCTANTTGLAPVFNYTSGGAAAAFATAQSFTVTCTNSVPYTLSLDAGGTGYTGAYAAPTGTYTNTASTLAYTLSLPAVTTGTGTGAAQTWALTGSMAAGQAGKCTAATCAFVDTHTLTITY